jgi:cell division protein FtsB
VAAVTIVPGANTGTAVNQTIVGIRTGLQDASTRTIGAGQQYATLRGSSAQQLAAYYQAQAQISARLQIGTTRGNPDLVAQWNTAQSALDQLTANINALNTLIAQINGEATRVRSAVAQVQQALDMPGAVDEDHRQLTVLEDEANQIAVVLDRLARDASSDLHRQTATLSNERSRLAQLATSIKAGDLYATGAPAPRIAAAAAPPPGAPPAAGAPIVSIKFARANTNYQKTLYAALSQALQTQPGALFDVVGVSPTRGTAAAVQTAQNDARRHAQDVMKTMTEMGVPAARMDISSATDPSVRTSEVRVFLR